MDMTPSVTTFTVRFDERTKQILCALLDNAVSQTSQAITAGDYSDEILQQHEELVQVKRGILYSRPEVPEVDTPAEVSDNNSSTADIDLDLS